MTKTIGQCIHTFGIGPKYGGGIKLYQHTDFMNPMKDIYFSFCPFCGKDLTKEEEEGKEK